jgi:hypothetical protein
VEEQRMMFARFFAIWLAVAVAAVPLAALADCWVKVTGTRDVPAVYGYGGKCEFRMVDANRRYAEASCPGPKGEVLVRQRSNPNSKTCIVSIWSSGMFKTTWHADLSRNDGGVCSWRWGGENTILLTIKNDIRD